MTICQVNLAVIPKGCATRVTRIQVLGNGSCQWRVLDRLVEGGKTVVVIEHNPDVIKTADWVIDLGPEGGDGGGRIVAEGTPERVAATGASFTGRFLAPLLPKAPLRRAARQAQARASDTREGRAGLA